MSVRQYPKGSLIQVSKYFRAAEFDCPCSGCAYTLIDDELVVLLDRLRGLLEMPLRISKGGGYRCSKYQRQLALRGYETATGRSRHEEGQAADVSTGRHSGAALEVVAREAGFRAVGRATNWIHVDTRLTRHAWAYGPKTSVAREIGKVG